MKKTYANVCKGGKAVKKRYAVYTLGVAVLALTLCMLVSFLAPLKSDAAKGTPESGKIDAIQFGDLSYDSVCCSYDRFAHSSDEKNEKRIVFASHKRTSQESPLYNMLLDGLRRAEAEISFEGLDGVVTKEDLNSTITKILNSNPELFYVKPTYSYYADGERVLSVAPQYMATGDELASQKKEYEELVLKIVKEIDPAWSDLEKVLFVHDHIVKNFRYDPNFTEFTENTVYDSYRFLKKKVGVCQAYTLLAIELFNRLEINSGAVASISMNHVWNCVEIDGKWYHLDITWDDAMVQGNFDRFDDVIYTNFLCGNAAIEASGHYEWESDLVFDDGYDNFFVKGLGVCLDIAPLGEDWYLLVKDSGSQEISLVLGQIDFENNTYNRLVSIPALWFMWESTTSYYLDTYAGLGSYFGTLVISTSDAIYAYDPTTAELTEIEKYRYDGGYIYGMRISGKEATFRVAKAPKFTEKDSYITVDLSDIKFKLEITYENILGEQLAPTYTAEIGWGRDFSVDFPTVDGFFANEQNISGKMPIGGVKHRVLYEKYRKLVINYLYENGEKVCESYIDELASVGKEYIIPSPTVAGYRPDMKQVEIVMSDEDVEINVIYVSTLYTIKINYVYEDGSPVCEPYLLSDLVYMTEYHVDSPMVNGYTASVSVIEGSITDNIEINVIYTPITCKIRVEYIYSDGTPIEVKTLETPFGSVYEIASPEIVGYLPDISLVSGTADGEELSFKVTYSARKYTLTVKYVHVNGEEVYPPYVVENMDHMAEYSVETPALDGYISSIAVVSGNITEDTEITVVYHLEKYTVRFMSEGMEFYTTELAYGSVIDLPMSIPVKEANKAFYYVFLGWSGYYENITVSGDMVFEAVFEEAVRSYTVVFRNYDGTILYMVEVEYGGSAEYKGKTPEHEHETGKICEFVGWDKPYDNISADTELTAVFSDGKPLYTVYFYDWDGTLISTQNVLHGESAVLPDTPSRASDNTYDYAFDSWDGEYKKVRADSVVTAKYTATYIDYRIIFKNYDGSVLAELVLHYGDDMIPPESPIHEGTELYEYIFSAWSPTLPEKVTQNAEYTAQFTEKYRFAYLPQDFINAVDKIAQAKTPEERFSAMSEAYKIKSDVYLKDAGVAASLEILDKEIEKYNSEVKMINEGFTGAVEASISVNSFSISYVTFFALLWTVLKKLLGHIR